MSPVSALGGIFSNRKTHKNVLVVIEPNIPRIFFSLYLIVEPVNKQEILCHYLHLSSYVTVAFPVWFATVTYYYVNIHMLCLFTFFSSILTSYYSWADIEYKTTATQ